MKAQLMNEMRIALGFFDKEFTEKSRANDDNANHYACAEIALRRIVPQQPIDKSQNPADWHIMCCPTCNRTFWNSGEFVHYQPHYCENCGQAIDWSDHPTEKGGAE